MISIRRAVVADAAALAALAEKTFRDTFGASNRPDDMDLHCRQSYAEVIQAREIADRDRLTWLAVAGGMMAGFAQLRWGPTPACVPERAAGELQRIYVDRAWHGQGIAQALMAACVAEFQRRGTEVIWLGVWEHNSRALAFYRKQGFEEVGDHVFQLGEDPQRDLILARPTRGAG